MFVQFLDSDGNWSNWYRVRPEQAAPPEWLGPVYVAYRFSRVGA